ncbi:heme-binding protein FetB [Porphyromonas crevioricanis JCM 15906]|nr:heme-binding protein FetB [Porphyromonas crevioricanis JCM 15906]GAD08252.1 heme-binding protein FetB [Porphyromonas crevioricanis JCM 13913]
MMNKQNNLFLALHSDSLMSDFSEEGVSTLIALTKIDKQHSEALLLVTFGSTYPGPHQTYARISKAYRKAFPDRDIYWAFTSKICIKRWAKKTGQQYHTPDFWLEALTEAGYRKIVVQSLHIIPGQEYLLVRDTYIKPFLERYPEVSVRLGEPLLSSEEESKRVAHILHDHFADLLHKGHAVAFMGHGNANNADYEAGNRSYHYVQDEFARLNDRLFLSTVEYPGMLFSDLLANLSALSRHPEAVHLVPLMSVAGDHACNDMAGDYDPNEPDEEQSWKVQLTQNGYTCQDEHCHLIGLGDFEELQKLWIEHTWQALPVSL